VKLVDANVLIYAVNRDAEHHDAACRWLDEALTGDETVAFAWVVLLAFVRITTHPGIFESPLTREQAFDSARSWLDRPNAIQLHPSGRHFDLLRGMVDGSRVGGNLVNDAHLAVLAIEHDATVVSFDADFARFGVRVHRPG